MPYKQDTTYDLTPLTASKYIVSSHHRRSKGNKDKCVWTITHDEEVECFIFSKNSGWAKNHVCWGLRLVNDVMQAVGRTPDSETLKIAKFVDGDKKDIWHGYTADFKNRKQDIPDTEILTKWKDKKYINKSDVRKMKQQLPCSL